MRKYSYLFFCLSLLFVCCSREEYSPVDSEENYKIVLSVGSKSETKGIEEVLELSEFNCIATVKDDLSESLLWGSPGNRVFSGTQQNGYTSDGVFWPASNCSVVFYGSNSPITYGTSGPQIKVTDISKDIVCSRLEGQYRGSKEQNRMVFDHIFARVGEIVVENYESFTEPEIFVECPTSGTYNLKSGLWSGLGPIQVIPLNSGDNRSEAWIIPGTYQFTFTFKDAFGEKITRICKERLEMKAGKINSFKILLKGDDFVVDITEEPIVDDEKCRKEDRIDDKITSEEYESSITINGKSDVRISSAESVVTISASARHKKCCYKQFRSSIRTGTKVTKQWKSGRVEIDTVWNDWVAGSVRTEPEYYDYEFVSDKYNVGSNNPSMIPGSTTGEYKVSASYSGERSVTLTCTNSANTSATATATLTQSEDQVLKYEKPNVTFSYPDSPVAYNSTSPISPELVVTQKFIYVSGKEETVTLQKSDYTATFSGSVNGLQVNSSTGVVTPSDNTGRAIDDVIIYDDINVIEFSYDDIGYQGGKSNPKLEYSQDVMMYTDGRESTASRSTKVSVSVTANDATASADATVVQNGDKGQAQSPSSTTLTTGSSNFDIEFYGSENGFSLNSRTGVVTAAKNLGSGEGTISYGEISVNFSAPSTEFDYTGGNIECYEPTYSQLKTVSGRSSTSQRLIYVTVLLESGDKSVTKTVKCYQNGDPGTDDSEETITSGGLILYTVSGDDNFSNYGSKTIFAGRNVGSSFTQYSDVVISSFSYPDMDCSGGYAKPSIECSQTKTSGRSKTESREATMTATVKLNGKSASSSITFTQKGDSGEITGTSDCYVKKEFSFNVSNDGASFLTSTGWVYWEKYTGTLSDRSVEVKVIATGSDNKSATATAVSTQLKAQKEEDDDDWDIEIN